MDYASYYTGKDKQNCDYIGNVIDGDGWEGVVEVTRKHYKQSAEDYNPVIYAKPLI